MQKFVKTSSFLIDVSKIVFIETAKSRNGLTRVHFNHGGDLVLPDEEAKQFTNGICKLHERKIVAAVDGTASRKTE